MERRQLRSQISRLDVSAFQGSRRRRQLAWLDIDPNGRRFRVPFRSNLVRVILFRLPVGNGRTRMLVVVMSFAVKHGVVVVVGGGSLLLLIIFVV
jgi:hypothetical protein